MASFSDRIAALCAPLDPVRHGAELARLRACRALTDLDAVARDGWLTPATQKVRLKLVRHGSGTFLVVSYEDGWSKTISQG